jgi:ABC-type transport system substrate-binding protein
LWSCFALSTRAIAATSTPPATPRLWRLERLTFKIYDKIDTACNDFLASNLDLIRTTPPAKVPEARSRLGTRRLEQPLSDFVFVAYPLYQSAFQNKKLRQALCMAIDRQALIDGCSRAASPGPGATLARPLLRRGRCS